MPARNTRTPLLTPPATAISTPTAPGFPSPVLVTAGSLLAPASDGHPSRTAAGSRIPSSVGALSAINLGAGSLIITARGFSSRALAGFGRRGRSIPAAEPLSIPPLSLGSAAKRAPPASFRSIPPTLTAKRPSTWRKACSPPREAPFLTSRVSRKPSGRPKNPLLPTRSETRSSPQPSPHKFRARSCLQTAPPAIRD